MRKHTSTLWGVIGAIVFVIYNAIVFIAAGFTGHTATFWTAWAFMNVGMMAAAVVLVILGKRLSIRDWLFGFPVAWHTTAYLIIGLTTSTLFIVFERLVSWKLALPVQLAELAVYCVFAISCFIGKEKIDEIQDKVKDKTAFIKLLRVDVEMLVGKCSDAETSEMLKSLAEKVRYSDPMSAEALFELEKEISFAVTECDEALVTGDYELAQEKCRRAEMLLSERNKKCKALK